MGRGTGVVPLAAALSIPLTTAAGRLVPGRDLVLVLAAVYRVLARGAGPDAGAAGPGGRHRGARGRGPGPEATLARLRITEAGLAWLEQLTAEGAAPDETIKRLRRNLQARTQALEDDAGYQAADGAAPGAHAYLRLRRGLLTAQRDERPRMHAEGEIGEDTRSPPPASAGPGRSRPHRRITPKRRGQGRVTRRDQRDWWCPRLRPLAPSRQPPEAGEEAEDAPRCCLGRSGGAGPQRGR